MAGSLLMNAAGVLLALLSPLAFGQDAAAPATSTEVIQARTDDRARLTVPVEISGSRFHFLIDTGAERTILSHDVARRLGLVARGSATILGIAGSGQVPLVQIEDFAVGRRRFHTVIAPLLHEQFIGAEGIVGLDSLQGQRVLLDFGSNRLTIVDSRTPNGNAGFDIVVTARRRLGQLIVSNARIEGVQTDIIIDTGAEVSIGNGALQRALQRNETTAGTLVSVTGQQMAARVRLVREISFGRISFTDSAVAFADAPPFAYLGLERRPALLLGMAQLRLFKRVAIDFRSRKILFDLPDDIAGRF